MDRQSYDYNSDSVFHERPHLLATKGYRGFTIKQSSKHWDGLKITAANKKGMKITAGGDTEKEVLKKLIDQIDLFLDQ